MERGRERGVNNVVSVIIYMLMQMKESAKQRVWMGGRERVVLLHLLFNRRQSTSIIFADCYAGQKSQHSTVITDITIITNIATHSIY